MQDKAYDRLPTKHARNLRNNPTDAERKLWDALRNRQLAGVRFNRQVPIGPFICDFVSRASRLIIEVDGGQHSVNSVADEARSTFLRERGFRVLRFWNNEILGNSEGVLTTIERALMDRPSPIPSRMREGSLPS